MTRYLPFAAAVALLATGPVSSAVAQPQPPVGPPRPAFSPYLGLLWGGANPAFNYAAIVQPQVQFQQQFGQLQMQMRQNYQNLQTLSNTMAYGINPNLPISGHAAVFNNTGHYFASNPAMRGGSIGGGVGMGMGSGFVPGFNTYARQGGMGASGSGNYMTPGGSALGASRTRATARPGATGR